MPEIVLKIIKNFPNLNLTHLKEYVEKDLSYNKTKK